MVSINIKQFQSAAKKGLLLAGLLLSSVGINAQIGKDTVKVIYPDGSVAVENVGATKPYERIDSTLFTPDDLSLQSQSQREQAKLQKKQGRDWARWKPNPKRALWLALVLPGAGQIYNRKYWKLPIIYGGFVGCIYAMSWNNQMYHDYAQAYKDITDSDPNTHSYDQFLHLGMTITPSNEKQYQTLFKKRKDKYRRWRDMSVFATIAVYALSVIDAYVDASLSDFDISDDLSLHVAPVVINDKSWVTPNNPFKSSAVGVGCSLNF